MSHGGESNGHLMEETDEEMNIIEASGGKEEPRTEGNNNFMTNDTTEDNDSNNNNRNSSNNNRSNVNTGSEGTRQRPYHQYPYQKDYQEALRSLLWEPYDCRKASDTWYYEGLDDDEPQADVSQQNFMSFSESSLSSCSSCSSLDEILTVEMTPKSALTPVDRYSLNIEKSRDGRRRCTSTRRDAARPSKMKDTQRTDSSGVLLESNLTDEKEDFISGFTEFGCSTDPVQNLMNLKKMVSDLDAPVEEEGGFGSYGGRDGALASNSSSLSSRTSQCVRNSCAREASCSAREKNVLSTVNKMLVTVEGTLEPRDSNEGTQLVSPDTSLDLNENPVRLSGQTRVEPGPSSSSSGNVSVVNCYRAVPVSVVSTVPTIKCLNTQENVSNVHIIQNNAGGEQKPAGKCPPVQAKKFPVRSNANACVANPVPSSSRIRTKAPRDGNRNQSRNSLGSEQTPRKIERERPKSMNGCASEQSGQRTPGLSENGPTSSNNGGSVLSNHSRSVSNPVLGNQAKPMSNKYGSQQNIPIRLETHFGPSCSEGTERSQTYLTQGNVSGPVTQVPVPTGENNVEQAREAGGNGNGTNSMPQKQSPRTFTSTEAQTDDVPLGIHPQSVINREQRRRERRERRHQRRLHQSVLNSGSVWQSNVDVIHRDRRGLPDILNSHMPPPYSAVPVPAMSAMPPLHVPPPMPVPPGPQTVPHLVDSPPGPPLPHQNGLRFLFPFPGGRRSQGQMFAHEEETPKSCCGVVVTQTVSIRWFIVMISFVGICCVIVGTVLGAMKASGREHLTVSLLMIGVGIVLVTVSVVAWRLTSQDAPSCRSMLGLGGGDDSTNEPNQRFVPRMPPSYGRPHHPYAAMMYPEFQYRPPPPSYQASMQEYRLRLLLLERPNDTAAGLQAAMSPPPTYRSQAGSTLGLRAPAFCRSLPQSEYSHPPSYRSRTSSTRPTLDPHGDALGSVNHSRNSSLLSHVSDQTGNVSQAVVNVISVVGNTVDLHRGDTDLQLDSIKLEVDEEVPIPPLRMLLNKGKRSPTTTTTTTTGNTTATTNSDETKSENVNLVTIVTVSDNNVAPSRDHAVESDVLAHL